MTATPFPATPPVGSDWITWRSGTLYHSTAIYPCVDGANRMAYSGTHEPTAFQERDSGNILVVELDGPGCPPVIDKIGTHVLEWQQ